MGGRSLGRDWKPNGSAPAITNRPRRQELDVNRWLWATLIVLVAAVGVAAGSLTHVPVNSLWVPVIAALGAAGLTAVAAIGVELVREDHAAKGQERTERREAYIRLLKAAALFITLATTIREIRKLSTGPGAMVRISDPLGFMVGINRDLAPMWDAWSEVWLHGSQEAVTAANRVIDSTQPVIGLANVKGEGRSPFTAAFLGEKWTADQEKAFTRGLAGVGKARLEFAAVARKELGAGVADLVAGTSQDDSTC